MRVLALSLAVLGAGTASAQYVEQGDASHIFAEAQYAGSFPIQGSLARWDADIYIVCETSSVPVIHRFYTETAISPESGRPHPAQTYVGHGPTLASTNWAFRGLGDGRSNFVGLWPAEACAQVGVSVTSGLPATYPALVDNPLRVDATMSEYAAVPHYTLERLASRYVRPDQIQALPQIELNNILDPRVTEVECDEVEALTWTYLAREVGDVERTMVRLGASCTGYTVRTYANNGGNCIELRPDGSVVQARHTNVRHLDHQDLAGVYPAPAPFQNGRDAGALCEIPVTAGNTLVSGIVLLSDNGHVREPGDCSTCVNDRASAWPVRRSPVVIQFVKPGITWADEPVRVVRDAISGYGLVVVSRDDSRQVLGYHVALPDLGYQGDLISVTDQNAATRWSRPGLVVDTLWLSPGVLPETGSVRVVVTPLGADGHWDRAQLDPLALDVTTEVVVPDEQAPAALGFGLSVTPNPARSHATVHLTSATPRRVTIVVVDALGREVSRSEPAVSGTRAVGLDLRALAPGAYVVRAADEAGAVATTRIAVVR